MTYDSSVVVYFGTSNSAGQDFQLDFQQLPNSQTNSWLSFGIAWSAGGGQYSNIKARNNQSAANTWTYLSGSAGGSDDGDNGSNLITVASAIAQPTQQTHKQMMAKAMMSSTTLTHS
jgi:hypothetical protein